MIGHRSRPITNHHLRIRNQVTPGNAPIALQVPQSMVKNDQQTLIIMLHSDDELPTRNNPGDLTTSMNMILHDRVVFLLSLSFGIMLKSKVPRQ